MRKCPNIGNAPLGLIGLVIAFCLCAPLPARTAAADPLQDGSAALEDELYEVAEKKFKQLLDAPTLPPTQRNEVIILLSHALYGQKRYQEMLELLEKNRIHATNAQTHAFDFWTAMAYYELGQRQTAIDFCERFVQHPHPSPFAPRALRLKIRALLKLGADDEALACFGVFDKNYRNDPENTANRLDWAETLIRMQQPAAALALLEQMKPVNPDTRAGQDYLNMLGRIYMHNHEWNKARAAFLQLTQSKQVPDEFRLSAFLTLADIAEAQTNLLEALQLLDTNLPRADDPATKGILSLRKGKLLLKTDRTDDGINMIRSYVAAESTNPIAAEVQLDLANLLLQKEQFEKAATEFQNYLETFADPHGVALALRGKGSALFQMGRHQEAAATFRKAAETAPATADKALNRMLIADAQFAAGQYKLAIETYTNLAAQWPETDLALQAQYQAGEGYIQLGETNTASTLLWDLIDLDQDNYWAKRALLRLADLTRQSNQNIPAAYLYHWASAQATPEIQAQSQHGLALMAYNAGDFSTALKRFKCAHALAPQSAIAEMSLYLSAWCHVYLGQDKQAMHAFGEFAAAYPAASLAPNALFQISEQAFNQKNFASAEKGFLDLARNYPRAPLADTALFWAGRAALAQNEFRRANNHFNQLIKEYPSSAKRAEARFYQSAALCEMGEFAATILIYDEIIRQFPDTAMAESAILRKGDAQFALGAADSNRYDEAIASYQLLLERPASNPDIRLQAEYKIGRCLEKSARGGEAFERYMNAVYLYLKIPQPAPRETVWFTRAAFNAAGLQERNQSWRKAAAIYQRIIDANVPSSAEARQRLDRLRTEHWLHFY